MHIKHNKSSGFSLLEVSIALVILGILLAYSGGLFELMYSTDRVQTQQQHIQKVNSALRNFLAVNSFLPCPDTGNDGKEDRNGIDNACAEYEGYLPYKDLGVSQFDAWEHEYYYRVNANATNSNAVRNVCQSASVFGVSGVGVNSDLKLCPVTNRYYCSETQCNTYCKNADETSSVTCTAVDPLEDNEPPYFYLATPPYDGSAGSGNLKIYDEGAASPHGGTNGDGTVAVAISWGANGGRAYCYGGDCSATTCANGSADEKENCNGDVSYIDMKTGEDRDYMTWITVNDAKMAVIYSGDWKW